MSNWSAPVPLDITLHNRKAFTCGNEVMDAWVHRYAAQSHVAGTARMFASTPVGTPEAIAGFYTLSTGSVSRQAATALAAKSAPDPVPALLIGRMAVDLKHRGQGLGSGLLRDAMQRTLAVARNAGVKVLLVHVKDEAARDFYLHHEFDSSPIDDMTLMLLVQDIPGALET